MLKRPLKQARNASQIVSKPVSGERQKLLVVDLMSLLHRIYHMLPEMATKTGMRSTVCYGFLRSVNDLWVKVRPDEIAFCTDSRENVRKKIFPEYKAKRKERNERYAEFISQVEELKKRLPAIGFPLSWCDGYESDDVMAVTVTRRKFREYVIATSDNDLYQLADDDLRIWDLRLKKHLDRKAIEKAYWDIPHPLWIAWYKAMAGCNSDGVPGLSRWGKKKAIKFLKEHAFDPDDMILELDKQNLLKRFVLMLRLVALPFDMDYDIPIATLGTWGLNRKELKYMMMEYDIRSIDAESYMRKEEE